MSYKSPPEFVTVREAADLLQVSARTVKRWLKAAKLTGVSAGSGRQRVHLVERDSIELVTAGDLASVRRTEP